MVTKICEKKRYMDREHLIKTTSTGRFLGCPSTDMDDPYDTSYRNVGSVFLRKNTINS